jgi:hypothetical protein
MTDRLQPHLAPLAMDLLFQRHRAATLHAYLVALKLPAGASDEAIGEHHIMINMAGELVRFFADDKLEP